jgi:hypothetical protein
MNFGDGARFETTVLLLELPDLVPATFIAARPLRVDLQRDRVCLRTQWNRTESLYQHLVRLIFLSILFRIRPSPVYKANESRETGYSGDGD